MLNQTKQTTSYIKLALSALFLLICAPVVFMPPAHANLTNALCTDWINTCEGDPNVTVIACQCSVLLNEADAAAELWQIADRDSFRQIAILANDRLDDI